jgi:2-dehydro-3-deoxygluconokinase
MTRVTVVSDVLTIGEAMIELRPAPGGFAASVAGDAFNTAAWLARTGARATHAQDLGDDLLCARLEEGFAARGVAWHGRRTAGAGNGMYVVDVDAAGERRFEYFRAGSAAGATISRDTVGDLVAAAGRHDLVLITGVTVAITADQEALDALVDALPVPLAVAWNARPGLHRRDAGGALVECHPTETARRVLSLARRAAVVLASEEDLLLGNAGQAGDLAAELNGGGATVAVTRGPDGARVWHDGRATDHPSVRPAALVDTAGAGDAFAAGFVAGWLERRHDPGAAAARGAELAAQAVACAGALPS